jgi:anti-sigma regulatory factor (Ser/Thr protein kinase)
MKRKFTFTSDPCHLAEMRHEARSFLTECGIEECAAELLILAVDEACTNIIRYAYGHECRPIRMHMERLRGRVRFVIRDYGKSCDPSKIHSRALEDIRPGGVGVHIIKQAFDHVTYDPQPRGTRLILEKHLTEEPSAVSSGS